MIVALSFMICPAAFATTVENQIKDALRQVSKLQVMKDGETYTLPARGKTISGSLEDFLRRRDPDEVLASGLSTGCGDFAAAFYGLMRAKGAKLLYIDAVELSAWSWLNRYNGHTGVAVEDPEIGKWVLVDPTSNAVLTYDWDRKSSIYHGPAGRFWIWYVGKLEDYPVRDNIALQHQFDRALRAVPKSVWEDELVQLDIKTTPSLRNSDGSFLNPRLGNFLERVSKLYVDMGVHPKRRAEITLVDAGAGSSSGGQRTGARSWEFGVARDAGMSLRFFSWVERSVTSKFDKE